MFHQVDQSTQIVSKKGFMAKVVKKTHTHLYVYIRKEQRTQFKKLAAKKDLTLSGLMRNVLEEYLENELKKPEAQ